MDTEEIELSITERALSILHGEIRDHNKEQAAASGRLYQCSICGRRGQWSGSWLWHGTLRELEETGKVLITCSRECFEEGCRQQEIANAEKERRRSVNRDAANRSKRGRIARRDI